MHIFLRKRLDQRCALELLPDLMAARPAPPKKTGKATKKGDTAAEHSTMTLNHFVNSTTAAVAQGVSDSSS
jgi:hypothetical protein